MSALGAGPTPRQFVLAANRLPVRRVRSEQRWETSPGGLVSALASVVAQRDVAWVGWPGERSKRLEPFVHRGTLLVPVSIDEGELAGFYDGFSNATLWPLFHDLPVRPRYHRHWWHPYRAVNERFAAAIAAVADDGALVWVHDYHLMLVPRRLRTLRPDLRIGFFLHIPFPSPDLYVQLPWRCELMDGVSGADLIGVQTSSDAVNLAAAARLTGALQCTGSGWSDGARPVEIDAFPISVDTAAIEAAARRETTAARAAQLRADLGDPRAVLLGVDRLDYTKGITVRLRALLELLDEGVLSGPDEVVFVQVAVPSRERLGTYAHERRQISSLVGEINGRHGRIGQPVVHYVSRNLPFDELVGLYRAADVMLVTPLKDGMNLVAKEFVAASIDGRGALVLSELAGAARELDRALIVNPYDVEAVKRAIFQAVRMPPEEQAERLEVMRRYLEVANVHCWANGFVERLRGVGRSRPAAPA